MFSKPFLSRQGSRMRKPGELLLVPMIDIFMVMVTFLLMTAVFSRISIVQLDLPSAASAAVTKPEFRLEVIVLPEGFELTDGSQQIAAIPLINGDHDLRALSDVALAVKREHPQAQNASVLMHTAVRYERLIQAMDAIRSTEVPSQVAGQPATRVDLFNNIAVGDAP
jgi:biopolymer transport protein ExbD